MMGILVTLKIPGLNDGRFLVNLSSTYRNIEKCNPINRQAQLILTRIILLVIPQPHNPSTPPLRINVLPKSSQSISEYLSNSRIRDGIPDLHVRFRSCYGEGCDVVWTEGG